MHRSGRLTPPRAFVCVETVVSVWLMALVAGLALAAIFSYYQACWRHLDRQAVLWAAEAQLQRCLSGAPVDSPPPEGMIDEAIHLSTTVGPGQGQWQGFTRVSVAAATTVPGGYWRTGPRKITERISAYLPAEPKP